MNIVLTIKPVQALEALRGLMSDQSADCHRRLLHASFDSLYCSPTAVVVLLCNEEVLCFDNHLFHLPAHTMIQSTAGQSIVKITHHPGGAINRVGFVGGLLMAKPQRQPCSIGTLFLFEEPECTVDVFLQPPDLRMVMI